jgi:hypothetical protein
MNCDVEMASDGMIYIPIFMAIYSGIEALLRLLPQHSCTDKRDG